MTGLAKFSIVGLEGRGAILVSLFRNGGKLPSENRKLVSQGLVGSKKCGRGGKSSWSSNSLLLDLRESVWGGGGGGVSGKLKFVLDFLLLTIPLGMFEISLSISLICLF